MLLNIYLKFGKYNTA